MRISNIFFNLLQNIWKKLELQHMICLPHADTVLVCPEELLERKYDYSFIIYVVVWLNGRHFLFLTGQKTKIRTEKSVSDSQQMYHFKA